MTDLMLRYPSKNMEENIKSENMKNMEEKVE